MEFLKEKVVKVCHSELLTFLLNDYSTVLAVLNHHRQILSVNHCFLELAGVEDTQAVLGLRPGEALNCQYAYLEEGGCGTSEFCSTCGAAIAIVSAQSENHPVERKCSLSIAETGENLLLKVKCRPVLIVGESFYLLTIQDITHDQNRAMLERSFLHDINNMISALQGSCDLISHEIPHSEALPILIQSVSRLNQEIEIHRELMRQENSMISSRIEALDYRNLHRELDHFFLHHPALQGRKLSLNTPEKVPELCTDFNILLRLITNMITNALEAVNEEETVQYWLEWDRVNVYFLVHNPGEIERSIQKRIFQKNFSTKQQEGRGFGTYSMKLFSEQILNGTISFISTAKEGTIFKLTLPIKD